MKDKHEAFYSEVVHQEDFDVLGLIRVRRRIIKLSIGRFSSLCSRRERLGKLTDEFWTEFSSVQDIRNDDEIERYQKRLRSLQQRFKAKRANIMREIRYRSSNKTINLAEVVGDNQAPVVKAKRCMHLFGKRIDLLAKYIGIAQLLSNHLKDTATDSDSDEGSTVIKSRQHLLYDSTRHPEKIKRLRDRLKDHVHSFIDVVKFLNGNDHGTQTFYRIYQQYQE